MVGGSEQAFARATPILGSMGRGIVHVGPTGAGQVAKACNQLVVAATIEAVAEALVLAERSGVDRREGQGGAARWVRGLEDPRGPRSADARSRVRAGFRARLHRKDARIVMDAAEVLGRAGPVVQGRGRADGIGWSTMRVAANWITRHCSRCWTRPDACCAGAAGEIGLRRPSARPSVGARRSRFEVSALLGEVVLDQNRGRGRDVAADDPIDLQLLQPLGQQGVARCATAPRMSENRVAPESMALTIRVLQRFPSRSAARWKCWQMPSSCSFSGRMWASSYGSCLPPDRTIGGPRRYLQ